jgi:magnesium-transporting ATPase (P-type)
MRVPKKIRLPLREARGTAPRDEAGDSQRPSFTMDTDHRHTPWHSLSADEALAQHRSGPEGLALEEVSARFAAHGPNAVPEAKRRTLLRLFLGQFRLESDWKGVGVIFATGKSAIATVGRHEEGGPSRNAVSAGADQRG